MAGKSRSNRSRRAHTKRSQIKRRQPQDVSILEIELPHAELEMYEEKIVAILDGVTMQHVGRYQRALHMSRDVPIFDGWSELEEDDPYVQFYVERTLNKIDSDKVRAMMTLEPKDQQALINKAKRKAAVAYGAHVERIANDALQLGVLYYNDFIGETPDLDIRTNPEELEEQFGLPPEPERDMDEGFEAKLNFIRELAMTDSKFGPALNRAINASVKEAQERQLTGEPPEETEPASPEGFQPNDTD